MKRLRVILLVLLLGGCGALDGVGRALPSGSPLVPGLYVGEIVCSNLLLSTDEGLEETEDRAWRSESIGPNGLPMYDGEEIYEGRTTSYDAGYFTVTSITILPDGLVSETEFVLEGDRLGLLSASVTHIYKPITSEALLYSTSIAMSVGEPGDEAVGFTTCEGVLRR